MVLSAEPIVIVGGGPTGLATAVALGSNGIPCILLEKEPELPVDLRAGSFHPATIEFLDQLGVADAMHDTGIKVPRWQIRDRINGVVAEFDLSLLKDETRYPYRLHLEQHKLSSLLFRRAQEYRTYVDIRLGSAALTVSQDAGNCRVQLEGGEILKCAFVVACDGARSIVRKALDIEFEGFTWPERLAVASTPFDLGRYGFTDAGYIADPDQWAGVFRVPDDGPPGLWRIAYPTDPQIPEDVVLSPERIQKQLKILLEHSGITPPAEGFPLKYRSTYRVHQRVAKSFVAGRMALAGDAAHLNNPVGALGLNGAIHDAVNIAEKLSAIYLGGAEYKQMLDLYDRQRRPINIKAVQAQSIRNKKLLEERDPEKRRAGLAAIRRTATDPVLAKAYLMESSLINSVREAAAVR